MFKRMYEWTVHWSETRYASSALAVISFAESSFFPIPPDPLMMVLTTLHPKRWWFYALVSTITSVAGGFLGYFIGYSFYEFIGRPIIQAYGFLDAMNALGAEYSANAFFAVFTAAFTPIPYKVFTITAGVFHISLFPFITASILGRGGRFFIISFLMYLFGSRMENFIKKYFGILSFAFVFLVIAGFFVLGVLLK